jgi:hypothetical protein
MKAEADRQGELLFVPSCLRAFVPSCLRGSTRLHSAYRLCRRIVMSKFFTIERYIDQTTAV